jgi:hypothetical protein
VVVLLFSFTALGIGPFLAARWLHKRPIASLFGPRAGGWRAFQIAATVVFVAWTGFFILMYPFEIPETGVPPAIWAAWLPLALPGLLIQTGAEEVLPPGSAARWCGCCVHRPCSGCCISMRSTGLEMPGWWWRSRGFSGLSPPI